MFQIFILDKNEHKTSDIKDSIINSLNLSEDELKQTTSAGKPTIRNRIGWSISTLKKAGYIESQKKVILILLILISRIYRK